MKFNVMILLLCVLMCTTEAIAAEFSVHPSITVSEEYTDNIFESKDNKRTDYITRVLPGLALKCNAPFWDWDIAYNYDYSHYDRNTRDDDDTHNLAVKGLIKIVDEFLLLDISDTYRRVSLNVTRDYTRDSNFVNQSDSNTFTASPYFIFRLGRQTLLKTGYRYTNVWYRDPNAVDKQEHSVFMDAAYEYSIKISLSAGYMFTHQNSINAYEKHAPYIGARYEYADKSFVFAQGGYTRFDYKNGFNSNNPYWSAGITHTFDTFSVNLNAGVQYPEDPLTGVTKETNFSLGLNKNLERGTVGLSLYYSKFDEKSLNGTNSDKTSKYGAGISGKYDLTQKMIVNLATNVEKYEQKNVGSYTRRIYVNPGLSYSLPMDISVALNYSFIDYYSPGIFTDNYLVNRVILEARKFF